MFFFRTSARKEKSELAKIIKTQKDADEIRKKMQRSFVVNQRPAAGPCHGRMKSSHNRHYQDIPSPEPIRRQYTAARQAQSPLGLTPPYSSHSRTAKRSSAPCRSATPRPIPVLSRAYTDASAASSAASSSSAGLSSDDLPLSTAFRDADAQLVDGIMRLLNPSETSSNGHYDSSYGFGFDHFSGFAPLPPMRTATVLRTRPERVEPPAAAALEAKSMVAELVDTKPDPIFAPLDNLNETNVDLDWRTADSVLRGDGDPAILNDPNNETDDMPVVPPSPTKSSLRRSDAQRLPAVPRRHKLLRNVYAGMVL